MATRFYLVDSVSVTQAGETVSIPRHTDSDFIESFKSAQFPAPSNTTVTDELGVAAGDPIFAVTLEASSSELESLEQNAGTLIRVTDGTSPAVTVTPADAGSWLNQEFRPQSWQEFKESRDDTRDLSPEEWGEQLGVEGGF